MKAKIINIILLLLTVGWTTLPARAMAPNDQFYNKQWYIKRIMADKAWDKIHDAPNIVVAVIDSGVDINHSDLKNNLWVNPKEIAGDSLDNDRNGYVDDINGWDFVNNTPDPSPKFKSGYTPEGALHGTLVAGVIAAQGNNQIGVSGLAWQVKIMGLKALDDKGQGKLTDIVRAINYAVANGADIINLSFVSRTTGKDLDNALRNARAHGVIVVAAAGNEQSQGNGFSLDKTPLYPVCSDGLPGQNLVLGVAATDALDHKTNFSGYGRNCVDLAAPGVSVFGTVVYNQPDWLNLTSETQKSYDGYWSGTSMAVPMVSGALALVEAANPHLTASQTINVVLSTADNIERLNPKYSGQLGHGRLNVQAAVSLALQKLANERAYLALPVSDGVNDSVKLLTSSGAAVRTVTLGKTLNRPFVVASGDVNGDGQNELIVVDNPPAGNVSTKILVRIFDFSGKLLNNFAPVAWPQGANVAVADFDNDGQAEVALSPIGGAAAEILVFKNNSKFMRRWLAFAQNFNGGASLTIVKSNNKTLLAVGQGVGGSGMIRLFDLSGKLQTEFSFGENFSGGLNLAAVNLDDHSWRTGNQALLVAGFGPTANDQAKLFSLDGKQLISFAPFNKDGAVGLRLAAGDFNNQGASQLVFAPDNNQRQDLRFFSLDGKPLNYLASSAKLFPYGLHLTTVSR